MVSEKIAFDLTVDGQVRLCKWLQDNMKHPEKLWKLDEFIDEIVNNANEGNRPQCELRGMWSADGRPQVYTAWDEDVQWRELDLEVV